MMAEITGPFLLKLCARGMRMSSNYYLCFVFQLFVIYVQCEEIPIIPIVCE